MGSRDAEACGSSGTVVSEAVAGVHTLWNLRPERNKPAAAQAGTLAPPRPLVPGIGWAQQRRSLKAAATLQINFDEVLVNGWGTVFFWRNCSKMGIIGRFFERAESRVREVACNYETNPIANLSVAP
jgi:hypothetical protein